MLNFVRHKVSLNKIRYIKDGFDLDLTYITESIVAMGFPAVGMEAMYRNPRPQVQKLLEKLHRDKYKVYNLCAEPKWSYSPEVFHERVGRYPFHDHQAPPLALMGQFCKDVEEWLSKDKENIAAVHCKAGKGRAGMMICCWLVHSKTFPTAEEAMKQYGTRRTRDGKGVTIPSQRRYVTYYEDIVNFGYPDSPKIKVKSVFVQTSHYSKPDAGEPWVEILSEGKERLFASKPERVRGGDLIVEVGGVEVKGDIKVNVYDGSRAKKGKPICHFWFNTAWIEGNKLSLTRPQIDKAWNDKKFKVFQKDFEIVVEFAGAEVSTISQMRKNAPASSKSDKPSKSSKKEKKEKKERKHKKDEKKVEEGAKQLTLEEEKPKKDEVKTNGDGKAEEKPKVAEKVKEEKPEAKAEVKEEVKDKAEVIPEAKVQPQEPKDEADTVVFISSKPLESPKEERKDSSSDSSSSGEEPQSEDKPKGEEAKHVPVVDSTDDSSSTDSSEESSEIQQPPVPVVSEVKPEQPAAHPQEVSSDDSSSSTNSSEESSEGPEEKTVALKPSPSGEERDPVSSVTKQEKPGSDSSDDSSSSDENGEKGSSSESDSDL